MKRIFVLLGSNIDKERNIREAVGFLRKRCRVASVSEVYETCPVGLIQQPTFLNVALLIESSLSATSFRDDVLRLLESLFGRVRTSDKNAPRTIDADIILYDRYIFDLDDSHHIPDPELLIHRHVAVPIADLDPEFVHPESGETLIAIAHRLVEESNSLGEDPLVLRPDILPPQ